MDRAYSHADSDAEQGFTFGNLLLEPDGTLLRGDETISSPSQRVDCAQGAVNALRSHRHAPTTEKKRSGRTFMSPPILFRDASYLLDYASVPGSAFAPFTSGDTASNRR
jgi:hypothetical protein